MLCEGVCSRRLKECIWFVSLNWRLLVSKGVGGKTAFIEAKQCGYPQWACLIALGVRR